MTRRLLLLPILLLAAFLRLYHFDSAPPGLYRDEAMEGSSALEALETGRYQPFYPEDGGREGLYINVAAVSIRAFGNTASALRLPAAICGILTVWGLYALAAEQFSLEIGLLSAFFLATSFWHINFSRMAFRSIAAPMFLAWALYFVFVALRRFREAKPYWVIAVLAGVLYGLGFYTYIAFRATPLLLLVVWLSGPRKTGRIPALFAAAATITAAPLVLYFLRHPGTFLGRASQVAVTNAPHPVWEVVLNLWRTGRMFSTRGDVNWRHNIAWRAELFWPVAILFVLGIVLGKHRRFALCWLAVGALPAVLSGEAVPHALRSLLMVPAVCLLAAEGALLLYRWLAPRLPHRLPPLLASAVLLALAGEPYHTYFHLWAANPNVPPAFDSAAVRIAGQIRRLPPGTPTVVIAGDFVEAQPVMYLTRSYTPAQQRAAHIRYLLNVPCAPSTASPADTVFCLPGAVK